MFIHELGNGRTAWSFLISESGFSLVGLVGIHGGHFDIGMWYHDFSGPAFGGPFTFDEKGREKLGEQHLDETRHVLRILTFFSHTITYVNLGCIEHAMFAVYGCLHFSSLTLTSNQLPLCPFLHARLSLKDRNWAGSVNHTLMNLVCKCCTLSTGFRD
jgi:hypothetical protein